VTASRVSTAFTITITNTAHVFNQRTTAGFYLISEDARRPGHTTLDSWEIRDAPVPVFADSCHWRARRSGVDLGSTRYRAWRALGVGGLPPNIGGWVQVTVMRFRSRDPLTSLKPTQGPVTRILLDLPPRD
jgi:hypothetical protein